MLAVVGRKHAGKTTLVTKLSAELTRRGRRVMILKHGSHTFNLDPSGTDTYRHYHEGNAARVAMVSPDKFAFVSRTAEELSPEAVVDRYLADADLVLCEGFKRSAMPKLEIFRTAAHATALYPDDAPTPVTWRAMVSDVPVAGFGGRQFAIADGDRHIGELCNWIEEEFL